MSSWERGAGNSFCARKNTSLPATLPPGCRPALSGGKTSFSRTATFFAAGFAFAPAVFDAKLPVGKEYGAHTNGRPMPDKRGAIRFLPAKNWEMAAVHHRASPGVFARRVYIRPQLHPSFAAIFFRLWRALCSLTLTAPVESPRHCAIFSTGRCSR